MNNQKIIVNLKAYPLEAIYGAAYVFIDRAYIFLDYSSDDKIEINFRAKEKTDSKDLENLKGEFLNELLNYSLRLKIAKHNHKLREFIVSQALFASLGKEKGILENNKEKFEFEDDPLGIAIPWEEKYGK